MKKRMSLERVSLKPDLWKKCQKISEKVLLHME